MKEKIDSLINEIRDILDNARLEMKKNEPETKNKSIQLHVIESAANNLESQGIPVPEEIRNLKINLSLEVDGFNKSKEIYDYTMKSIHSFLITYKNINSIKYSKEKKSINHIEGDYKGKKPKAYRFKEKVRKVKNWRILYEEILKQIREQNHDFEKLCGQVSGTNRDYFSADPKQLRNPRKLPKSNIYFETNLSANYIVKNIYKIIEVFGYRKDDFEVFV